MDGRTAGSGLHIHCYCLDRKNTALRCSLFACLLIGLFYDSLHTDPSERSSGWMTNVRILTGDLFYFSDLDVCFKKIEEIVGGYSSCCLIEQSGFELRLCMCIYTYIHMYEHYVVLLTHRPKLFELLRTHFFDQTIIFPLGFKCVYVYN